MDVELFTWIKEATGALDVARTETIQSLWSGYGEITRVSLVGDGEARRPGGATLPTTAVLKWVKPPRSAGDRSASDAVSHARKCRSYDVELAFYRQVAPRCDEACQTAQLLAGRKREGEWLMLLTDLDAAGFAARHHSPRGHELLACLDWLAAFHARFMSATGTHDACGTRPPGLWSIGTYWHLDTRRDELANIHDATLRRLADELDRRLRAARFQTLVHGDAKPDNFCFTSDGRRVAAVDFQYVGGGVGVSDVAYLLHGSGRAAQASALDHYFARLRTGLPSSFERDALEEEWRALYSIASRDFERFLAGWRR